MILTRSQFDAAYAAGTLKIAFIGMSNIGKSYSAMRLATDYDFTLIEVDRLIWNELGETDMDAFAAWQGQPYSDGYKDRERQSIALETRATRESLKTQARNPILDTTGSVIYTDPEMLSCLREDWYVVYIEAADAHLERLKQQYFAHPKPLAWNGYYQKHEGLSEEESLMASYPALLSSRAAAYAALADHTVSSVDILTPETQDLFDLIKPS
jgi:shikimate kinase